MAGRFLPLFEGIDNPFVENKYYRWYVLLVSKPDIEGHTEEHHIIPKCFGGGERKSNIVRISLRKHFLAHWLLTKCTEGAKQKKMLHAFGYLTSGNAQNGRPSLSSWQYERAKIAKRDAQLGKETWMKGRKHTPEALAKLSAAAKGRPSAMKGKKFPPEVGMKISAANKGKPAPNRSRPMSPEQKEKNRIAKTGVKYSEDTKAKVSASLIGNQRKLGFIDPEETRRRKSLAHINQGPQKNNSTGLKGINPHQGKYVARFRRKYLGIFDCPATAHFEYLVERAKFLKENAA
jgi:hypothetical protein